MTEIAKAYVQLVPSAKGFKSGIENVIGDDVKGAGQSAGNTIASMIKKGLAIAGIGKVLKDSLTSGGELQQSLGGVETLFKDNSEKIKAYAAEAYKSTGLS